LPGVNAYDEAVASGILSYKEAIERENAEKAAASKELEKIAVEIKRTEAQVLRGTLITKDDCLSRIETVAAAFKTMLHLLVTRFADDLPVAAREDVLAKQQARVQRGLSAIAESMSGRRTREQTDAAVQAVFQSKE
jgi:hypothetical protein